jgi:hypothetical protein
MRSAVSGLSYVGSVCSKDNCAIVEERGGLTGTRVTKEFHFGEEISFKIFIIDFYNFMD